MLALIGQTETLQYRRLRSYMRLLKTNVTLVKIDVVVGRFSTDFSNIKREIMIDH